MQLNREVSENIAIEDRKTVMDVVIQKTIAEVLSDNTGNRLTSALIMGITSQISRTLLNEHRVTNLPQDIIERIRTLEQEVADLNDALEQVTAPTHVE